MFLPYIGVFDVPHVHMSVAFQRNRDLAEQKNEEQMECIRDFRVLAASTIARHLVQKAKIKEQKKCYVGKLNKRKPLKT